MAMFNSFLYVYQRVIVRLNSFLVWIPMVDVQIPISHDLAFGGHATAARVWTRKCHLAVGSWDVK